MLVNWKLYFLKQFAIPGGNLPGISLGWISSTFEFIVFRARTLISEEFFFSLKLLLILIPSTPLVLNQESFRIEIFSVCVCVLLIEPVKSITISSDHETLWLFLCILMLSLPIMQHYFEVDVLSIL